MKSMSRLQFKGPLVVLLSSLSLFLIGSFCAVATRLEEEARSNASGNNKHEILESLYRFPASLLGSEFQPLIDGLDKWVGNKLDEGAVRYARNVTGTKSVQRYYDECYSIPNEKFYSKLEKERKEIEHSLPDVDEEISQLNELFWEKQEQQQDDEMEDILSPYRTTRRPFFSDDGRWTWRPAGHFSSRGTKERRKFRHYIMKYVTKFMKSLVDRTEDDDYYESDDDGVDWDMEGRNSGMFWYPPGGSVREWHTNRLDIVGHPILKHQPWRMYYIRVANKQNTTTTSPKADMVSKERTGSGMHLLYDPLSFQEGKAERLSIKQLHDAGAIPIPDKISSMAKEENDSKGGQQVWRIPDEDGYVTIFRLLPHLFHCIVSDTNHRFSLGFAFSEQQIQNILQKAKMPFSYTKTKQSLDSRQENISIQNQPQDTNEL